MIEKRNKVPILKQLLRRAALVPFVVVGMNACHSDTMPTATPVTPISTSVETATPTQEELLAKHNARLVELGRIFKEEGKYPKEEVDQWLKAAGITWDTLTVHGLPSAWPNIIRENLNGRDIPAGAVLFGTNVHVKYPAYIEYPISSSYDYSSDYSPLNGAAATKVDDGKRTARTNVLVNNPTGAIMLKIDGTNIPKLSPK